MMRTLRAMYAKLRSSPVSGKLLTEGVALIKIGAVAVVVVVVVVGVVVVVATVVVVVVVVVVVTGTGINAAIHT
jgi:hypothetical protein